MIWQKGAKLMRYFLMIFCFVLPSPALDASPPKACCQCLPAGIKRSDVVSRLTLKPGVGKAARVVTVGQKLDELKAHCKRGKLMDNSGREIYFFHLEGCWGNPPENYQEVMDEQARKIAQLKKRYTVIEMTCNPAGELIN
jgi:hypothetical protein